MNEFCNTSKGGQFIDFPAYLITYSNSFSNFYAGHYGISFIWDQAWGPHDVQIHALSYHSCAHVFIVVLVSMPDHQLETWTLVTKLLFMSYEHNTMSYKQISI